MPILDLGDGPAALDRLDAVMAWPRDAERRRAFVQALHAERLARLGEGAETASGKALRGVLGWARDERMDAWHRDGGWGAAALGHPGAAAAVGEWRARQRAGFVAAEILLYVLTPAKGSGARGSVGEAVYLLSGHLRAQERGPASRERLMAAWAEMRPVAPLWAAVEHLGAYEAGSVALGELLAVAEKLRRRGEERGVLDPTETWRLPDGLALPPVEVALRPLPPRLRVALRDYSAAPRRGRARPES